MKNALQKVKTDEILAARAICNSYSCLHFAFVLHENALVFSQSDARSFSCILLFMVIGPSGVQFGLLSYEWLTKLDGREVGVNLSITSMIKDRIGRQEVLLPINQNCYNFRKRQIRLSQISLVETISKIKNFPFWKFLNFFRISGCCYGYCD